MAVLAEQGNSLGSQRHDRGTAADFVISPPCPAKALPSIDKVGHIQPYLFAGHQQLVVSDCHPMEQTGNHDHRFTPEAE
jgi:hypothetical protein